MIRRDLANKRVESSRKRLSSMEFRGHFEHDINLSPNLQRLNSNIYIGFESMNRSFDEATTWKQLIAGLVLFLFSLSLVGVAFYSLPPLTESERSVVGVPRSLEQVRNLAGVGSKYAQTHYWTVVLAVASLLEKKKKQKKKKKKKKKQKKKKTKKTKH